MSQDYKPRLYRQAGGLLPEHLSRGEIGIASNQELKFTQVPEYGRSTTPDLTLTPNSISVSISMGLIWFRRG